MEVRKIARLATAVLRYRMTGRPFPIAVAWMITGRCNRDCRYCDATWMRGLEELDGRAAIALVDQMADAGVRLVSITGGEPLVREDLGAIVRHIHDRGMVCKVNSNGHLLESRLGDLEAVDLLQLSLDGPGEDQDEIRGPGSFRAAVRAAELARRRGIPFHFVGVLTRRNVGRLEEVLDQAAALGGRISFQPMNRVADRPEAEEFAPSRGELLEGLQRLRRIREAGGSRGRVLKNTLGELDHYASRCRDGPGRVECAPVMATVMPDGRLTVCEQARNPRWEDVRVSGFQESFARMGPVSCDGCVCVGTLRLTRVCRLDPAVIWETLRD
ncbi:radical SAM protein [Myxococcota bacterium]|nr:radical SAM protein [Myxococcota bacterium]